MSRFFIVALSVFASVHLYLWARLVLAPELGSTWTWALSLALLGALAVTRHASASLFVRGVLPAPAAVLAKLNPIRVVPLRLLGLVVAPLAVLACEGHGDSNVSASHGSFGR